MPDQVQAKRPRADAERNRVRLLEAAKEAFASGVTPVTLEQVARDAGVGIGTLYRHFPTREALVEALYRKELADLCAAADGLLAARPAERALRAWMDLFADYVAAKRGMADALRSIIESGNDIYADTRGQLLAAFAALLQAGVDAGSLRPDINAEDVFRATGSVFLLPQEDGWREQAARLLGLIVDGLRYGAPGRD